MWDFSEEEIFDCACVNNLSGIEFWSQQIENKNLSSEKIRDLAKEFNLNLTLHAKSWDLNLASINKKVRDLSLRETLADIDLASKIGAGEITIHPGRFSVGFKEEFYYDLLRESFSAILNYSLKKKVKVSIEIMEKIKKEFIIDLYSLKKLTGSSYEDFLYTLDVAHCDNLDEIYFNLNNLKNISKVHISNRLRDKYHTELDRGMFPMEEIIEKIGEKNLPMVVEGMEIGRTTFILDRNLKFLKERKII